MWLGTDYVCSLKQHNNKALQYLAIETLKLRKDDIKSTCCRITRRISKCIVNHSGSCWKPIARTVPGICHCHIVGDIVSRGLNLVNDFVVTVARTSSVDVVWTLDD